MKLLFCLRRPGALFEKTAPGPRKNFCLFLLLLSVFSLNALAQSTEPPQSLPASLVKTVNLIDDPLRIKEKNKDHSPSLPNPLIIGIEMNEATFFKLTPAPGESSTFSTAGYLVKGINPVALSTDGLFERSGSHSFALDVKVGDLEQHVIITLDIEIKSLSAPNGSEIEEDTSIPRIYEVSVFVGKRLLGSLRQEDNPLARLMRGGKKEPAPIVHDPRYPVPGSRPPAAAVSPLSLAFLAIQAIKSRIHKNKSNKIPPLYTREISGTYLQKSSEGKERYLLVTFKISSQQPLPNK